MNDALQLNVRTLVVLTLLNDLRHAALDAFARKQKQPSLLLFYCFIDICATLSDNGERKTNRDRFEQFVQQYATCSTWKRFSTYDLWAARSSMLHAYSPLGDHTRRKLGKVAKPLFYYAWPEREQEMREVLNKRGYSDFVLVDVAQIKAIATDAFNTMWRRVEQDATFEALVLRNAEHLLRDSRQIALEDELLLLEELATRRGDT